jgi:hypothetical protein
MNADLQEPGSHSKIFCVHLGSSAASDPSELFVLQTFNFFARREDLSHEAERERETEILIFADPLMLLLTD